MKYIFVLIFLFLINLEIVFAKHFSTFGKYDLVNVNLCLEAWEKGIVYDEEDFKDGFIYKILYINYDYNFYKLFIDETISSETGQSMKCEILIDF